MFDFSAVAETHITFAAILPFILIGFLAQTIDGAMGMAFGVISNTLLMSLGLPPAAASASVHVVETFTTGASGISHALHRNVDKRLFVRLVVPGMIGGVLGAYVLSNIEADIAKPFVLAYLLIIGGVLLFRGLKGSHQLREVRHIAPIGLVGGFLDAAGGGGWGPVVTSNLLIQGSNPRMTVGTVNSAEFFLTLTISATFIAHLGIAMFTVATVGLLLGGLLAAPFGAYLAKRIPMHPLLATVGAVLIATSTYGIYRYFA